MNLRTDGPLTHPSFLALDRAHLGHASGEVTAHLGDCEVCRRYVDSPDSPASASGFAALRAALGQQDRSYFGRIFGMVSLAAAACGLIFVLAHRPTREASEAPAYLGVKGFRSVWIYVRRGSETELWDGRRPVASGDRVRLKVDLGAYRHVAVYSLDDAGHTTRLFAGGRSQGQSFTLPDAWEIDDSTQPERLFVIFSDAPVEPNWGDIRAGKAQEGVAVLPFVMPKLGSPGAVDSALRSP